jgi:hypothetical protein
MTAAGKFEGRKRNAGWFILVHYIIFFQAL